MQCTSEWCPRRNVPSADDRISLEADPTQLSSLLLIDSARIAIVIRHLRGRIFGAPVLPCISPDPRLSIHPGILHISRHLQQACQPPRKRLKEHKIQETRAEEEEVAEAGDVAEVLVEAHLWAPGTVQLPRATVEREEVEDGDEAGVVVEAVAEGVGEETELSRKDRDQQTHNLHHNPVVLASLVVA